jgi:hypothetical protein
MAAEDGIWWYEGARWTKAPFNLSAYSVDALSESEAWIGGQGIVYHFHGGCWDEYAVLPRGEAVSRIAMGIDGSGWAVATYGYVLRYGGGTWQVARGPFDPTGEASLPSELYDLETTGDTTEPRLWISGSSHSVMSVPLSDARQLPAITPATPVRPPTIPPTIMTPVPTATPNNVGKCPPREYETYMPMAHVQ